MNRTMRTPRQTLWRGNDARDPLPPDARRDLRPILALVQPPTIYSDNRCVQNCNLALHNLIYPFR